VHQIFLIVFIIGIAALASAINILTTVYQVQPKQPNQQPHQSLAQPFLQLQPPLNRNAMKEITDVLARI
jgi:hypothetical protein